MLYLVIGSGFDALSVASTRVMLQLLHVMPDLIYNKRNIVSKFIVL